MCLCSLTRLSVDRVRGRDPLQREEVQETRKTRLIAVLVCHFVVIPRPGGGGRKLALKIAC